MQSVGDLGFAKTGEQSRWDAEVGERWVGAKVSEH